MTRYPLLHAHTACIRIHDIIVWVREISIYELIFLVLFSNITVKKKFIQLLELQMSFEKNPVK